MEPFNRRQFLQAASVPESAAASGGMDQARATGINGQTMVRSKANQDAFRPAWEWMDLLASRKISAVEHL